MHRSSVSRIGSLVSRPFEAVVGSAPLAAIRQGLSLMIPVMVVGAAAIFVNNLPIAAYQSLMARVFGSGWIGFGDFVRQGTFSIMAVSMLITVSHSIARSSARAARDEVNPVIASIVALAALFALINFEDGFRFTQWLGPLGVFVAICVALLSTAAFIGLSSIPWLRLRMYGNAADRNLAQAMASLAPAMLTIGLFAVIHLLLRSLGIVDLHETINRGLSRLFVGSSSPLANALAFMLLVHLFWFFGIHGSNALEPVAINVFSPLLAVNQRLVEGGYAPTEIFTKQFFDVFVLMGGAGATLCLIVALLLGAKRSNTKQIATLSILPGLFNVNEIMVFGLPIILNLYLFVPFVLLPVLLTAISYGAMRLGLVGLTIAPVEWTTPIVLGGYRATGSVAGAALQLFNLAVGVAAYLPFIKLYERRLARDNQRCVQGLLAEVDHIPDRQKSILLSRNDDTGNLARLLVSDLQRDLREGNVYLAYQPQIDVDGRMYGVEALLRWKHGEFGAIAPPIAIALAEETPLIHEMGVWIIREACLALKSWQARGMRDVSLALNISPYQLDGEALPAQVKSILEETGLDPRYVEIEITEQTALGGLARLRRLNELKALGLRLAMDDFGMGHSSLMYLKELNLDTIKLDGALVKEVLTNERCAEIIGSILKLGASMGIDIIAEFVDTDAQRDRLAELGCRIFQGYLYSPPLASDRLLDFYNGTAKKAG